MIDRLLMLILILLIFSIISSDEIKVTLSSSSSSSSSSLLSSSSSSTLSSISSTTSTSSDQLLSTSTSTSTSTSSESSKIVKDDNVAVASRNCINISDGNVISKYNNHLDMYMKLPMERLETIPFAHGTKLEKSKTSELSNYELVAPPVQFLHLKVNPRVYTNITQAADSILITSHKCELSGSSMIENINKCFKFRVDTKFTWASTIDNNNIESKRQLCSASSVVVEINPPRMFSFIPKKLLEQTANLVISVTMNSLEEGFLSSLHDDYIRWAKRYEMTINNIE